MILIRKVKEEYGWLGNMSPYPVRYEGKQYRTSEALFQALRFDDDEIIESIRKQKSPMAAKMIAKKHRDHMVIKPMSDDDLFNMKMVLRLKLEQHPKLKSDLLATGEEEIVDDCTKRPRGSGLFWGAAFKNDIWVGENWLGWLLMEIRKSLHNFANFRPQSSFAELFQTLVLQSQKTTYKVSSSNSGAKTITPTKEMMMTTKDDDLATTMSLLNELEPRLQRIGIKIKLVQDKEFITNRGKNMTTEDYVLAFADLTNEEPALEAGQ